MWSPPCAFSPPVAAPSGVHKAFQLGSACVLQSLGVALGPAREAVCTDFLFCARGEDLSWGGVLDDWGAVCRLAPACKVLPEDGRRSGGVKEAVTSSKVQTGRGCRLEFIWSDVEWPLLTHAGLGSLLHPSICVHKLWASLGTEESLAWSVRAASEKRWKKKKRTDLEWF